MTASASPQFPLLRPHFRVVKRLPPEKSQIFLDIFNRLPLKDLRRCCAGGIGSISYPLTILCFVSKSIPLMYLRKTPLLAVAGNTEDVWNGT